MNAVPMIVPDTSTPLMVEVGDIDDRNRLRPIDPMRAEQIGASMEDRGQLQAIILRRKSAEEMQDDPRPYALVIGGHRLAGAKSLGWTEIRVEFRSYDQALQARFDEIDENLHRHELTALDRAIFLAESHRLWIQLHPESAHGKAKKPKKGSDSEMSQSLRLSPKRFSARAAEIAGLSERSVQAAVALANSLSPAAIEILRGSPIVDNAAELQRLAGEPAPLQVTLAGLMVTGGAPSVAKAKVAAGLAPTGDGDPQEDLFRRIIANWERLDTKGRRRFLDHAGLTDTKAARGRAPAAAGVVSDPRQVDLEDAIAASKTERRP